MKSDHCFTHAPSVRLLSATFLGKTILGLAYLMNPAITLSSEAQRDGQEGLWCHINFSGILPGNTGRSSMLPKDSIFIVKRDEQLAGQKLLEDKPYVELTAGDVIRFVGSDVVAHEKNHFYLVRASAIYDSSTDYELTLTLAAALYVETHTLNVYSFGLRSPEVNLKNLALVVKTPIPIATANAVCETAS